MMSDKILKWSRAVLWICCQNILLTFFTHIHTGTGIFLLKKDSRFWKTTQTTDLSTGDRTIKGWKIHDAFYWNGSLSCTGKIVLSEKNLNNRISFLFKYKYFPFFYSTEFRYIPVGVLEQPPQLINHRPPAYVGRDDMETMLASRNANDWIKIRWVVKTSFFY